MTEEHLDKCLRRLDDTLARFQIAGPLPLRRSRDPHMRTKKHEDTFTRGRCLRLFELHGLPHRRTGEK